MVRERGIQEWMEKDVIVNHSRVPLNLQFFLRVNERHVLPSPPVHFQERLTTRVDRGHFVFLPFLSTDSPNVKHRGTISK